MVIVSPNFKHPCICENSNLKLCVRWVFSSVWMVQCLCSYTEILLVLTKQFVLLMVISL